jgi:hypothetical protein
MSPHRIAVIAGDGAPRRPDLGGASDTRSLGAAIGQAI